MKEEKNVYTALRELKALLDKPLPGGVEAQHQYYKDLKRAARLVSDLL